MFPPHDSELPIRSPSHHQIVYRPPNPTVVSSTFNFPEEEEKVLKFWREIDAFQTSLKLSEGRPVYSFYDGPPFATGLPHYGHLLAGTIKVRNLSRSHPPAVPFFLLLIGGCARKPGRTSSRATRTSRASTCRAVSAGTRTAFPSSTRSTRS